MRRTALVRLAVLGCLGALAGIGLGAVPASGATNPALADCSSHGALTRSYSISQLRQALATMNPVTREYTNCPDVLNRALASAVAAGGHGTGTGTGGSASFLPTPVIVVIVLLILAAVTFGAVAVRRRRSDHGRGTG